MEFSLEVFYEIYGWCSSQTVYSLACTSSELNKLSHIRFEREKYLIDRKKFQIEHKKLFKTVLELVPTNYIIYDYVEDCSNYDYYTDYVISVRYDPRKNRRVGYRQNIEEIWFSDSDKTKLVENLAVVSSVGLYFTTDWKLSTKDGTPHYKFSQGRVQAVKYKRSRPTDPEDDDFICNVIPYTLGDHIVIIN